MIVVYVLIAISVVCAVAATLFALYVIVGKWVMRGYDFIYWLIEPLLPEKEYKINIHAGEPKRVLGSDDGVYRDGEFEELNQQLAALGL